MTRSFDRRSALVRLSRVKILMFGWEYPPLMTGGLGTACHGLVTSLLGQGQDVVFVMPAEEESGPSDSPPDGDAAGAASGRGP